MFVQRHLHRPEKMILGETGSGKWDFSELFLPKSAKIEDDAFAALGGWEADLLAVEHQGLVVVIDLLGRPVGGELGFEEGVGGADADLGGDQP